MQIGSRLFDGLVNPAPESHLVEFLQAGFVEAFADTIGRWMVGALVLGKYFGRLCN